MKFPRILLIISHLLVVTCTSQVLGQDAERAITNETFLLLNFSEEDMENFSEEDMEVQNLLTHGTAIFLSIHDSQLYHNYGPRDRQVEPEKFFDDICSSSTGKMFTAFCMIQAKDSVEDVLPVLIRLQNIISGKNRSDCGIRFVITSDAALERRRRRNMKD